MGGEQQGDGALMQGVLNCAQEIRVAPQLRPVLPLKLRPADGVVPEPLPQLVRSEEHTSELQSLMRISYSVFCLKKTKTYSRLTSFSRITMSTTFHNFLYLTLTQL